MARFIAYYAVDRVEKTVSDTSTTVWHAREQPQAVMHHGFGREACATNGTCARDERVS
jgi:hypothetical protein